MSAGHTFGKFVGATGAYVGHAVVVSARATGQFGADVIDGTQRGYVAKASELSLARQRALALREATVAKRSIAVEFVGA